MIRDFIVVVRPFHFDDEQFITILVQQSREYYAEKR